MFKADRAVMDYDEISPAAMRLFDYYCMRAGRDNPTCTASLERTAHDLKREYSYASRRRSELIKAGWILLYQDTVYILKGIEEYTEDARRMVADIANKVADSANIEPESLQNLQEKLQNLQTNIAEPARKVAEPATAYKDEPAPLTSPTNQPIEPERDGARAREACALCDNPTADEYDEISRQRLCSSCSQRVVKGRMEEQGVKNSTGGATVESGAYLAATESPGKVQPREIPVEHPALAALRETYELRQPPPIFDQERVMAEVADVETWRRVLKRLRSNGTPAKNVGTMLDVYHEQKGRVESVRAGPGKQSNVEKSMAAVRQRLAEIEESRCLQVNSIQS